MKCPKCGKDTLYFLPFQFLQIVLQHVISVVSYLNLKYLGEGCKNVREYDNKCVEHLMKLLFKEK